MRILLVRHGQSQGNIDGIIQGAEDPLTDNGRHQANLVGRFLASERTVTHLYASPYARARETAEIIGGHIGMAPAFERGLAEIDAGIAAGMTWDDWTDANPEAAARMRTTDRTLEDRWEGGESGGEFADRVFRAYDRIVTNHLGSDDVVTVVSHGGPLAWISARLHGDPLEKWPYERASFVNCSISEIEIDEQGAHTTFVLNQVEHLEALEGA